MKRECANCGFERDTENSTCCGSCGFTWEQIDQAERVVDRVGQALGVNTYTISSDMLRAAMDAALGEIVDPELTER